MARDTFDDRDETVLAQRAASGDALGNALIFVTSVILLGAFLLMEKALADKYNGGMFADKSAPPAVATLR